MNADRRAELIAGIDRLFQQLSWQGRQHVARQVEGFGLTVPQYVVLRLIHRQGPAVTMSDVVEALQLPASSLTGIMDRLVRQELVERVALPNDRRAVAARVTGAGRELVEQVKADNLEQLTAMLDGVGDDDLDRFGIVLARMLERVEQDLAGVPASNGPGSSRAFRETRT